MKTTLVSSHPDKTQGNSFEPLSDDARADIQAAVDESNVAFARAIARGRGMAPGDVARVHGSGRLFSAQRATAAGAIDGVMTLRDVVAKLGSSRSRLALMRRRAEVMGMAAAI
jgi:ClpP class serine protease